MEPSKKNVRVLVPVKCVGHHLLIVIAHLGRLEWTFIFSTPPMQPLVVLVVLVADPVVLVILL